MYTVERAGVACSYPPSPRD